MMRALITGAGYHLVNDYRWYFSEYVESSINTNSTNISTNSSAISTINNTTLANFTSGTRVYSDNSSNLGWCANSIVSSLSVI